MLAVTETVQLALLTAIGGGVAWFAKWTVAEMKKCAEDRLLHGEQILTLSVDVATLKGQRLEQDERMIATDAQVQKNTDKLS